MILADRQSAGQTLAPLLQAYAGRSDVVVLGIARGGVPVAYEISRALRAALDVVWVRRLGVPANKELVMGFVASGGVRLINFHVVEMLQIRQFEIDIAITEAEQTIERLDRYCRDGRPAIDLRGRTVIVVDDGIATGITMRAAVAAVKQRLAARIVVAAPTAAPHAYEALCTLADEVVCLGRPNPYIAVGRWYKAFHGISDEDVRESLGRARQDTPL